MGQASRRPGKKIKIKQAQSTISNPGPKPVQTRVPLVGVCDGAGVNCSSGRGRSSDG